MADHTISITNTVNTFGPWPEKWGIMQWGVDKWGEGTQDLPCDVGKFIDNATALDGNTLHLSVGKLISNETALAFETSGESLKDPAGYNYVFTKPDTDAENRTTASFTAAAAASTTYTSAAAASTSWS